MELPKLAIDIENTVTQEVSQDRGEGFSFGIIVKSCFEHVFDVGWISGNDVVKNVDMDGGVRRISEKMSVPIAKIGELGGPAGCQVSAADVTLAEKLLSDGQEYKQK